MEDMFWVDSWAVVRMCTVIERNEETKQARVWVNGAIYTVNAKDLFKAEEEASDEANKRSAEDSCSS